MAVKKYTKSQFKSLVKEMVVVEFSKAEDLKRQKLSKIEKNPHSLSGWFKRRANDVWATKGDLEKLINVLGTAIKSKDLKISNDKYQEIEKNLKRKPNNNMRMKYMSDLYLKGAGLGVT